MGVTEGNALTLLVTAKTFLSKDQFSIVKGLVMTDSIVPSM
jgi:hypothetical protein